jgi:hypothetical protein
MTADDFPLPSCAALAEDVRAELEDGSGIVLLQGFDPSRYSLDELKLLYAAISRQIGTLVYSNRAGEIMREIRDVGRDSWPRVFIPSRARGGKNSDPVVPARDEQPHRTVAQHLLDIFDSLRRHCEGRHPVEAFALRPQRLAAGGQNRSRPRASARRDHSVPVPPPVGNA